MKPCLSLEHLEALRRLDTCAVANAIDTFELRLRNEGYAGSSIHCLFPRLASMVGYAVTLKIRCSTLPTTGHAYVDRTDWWTHILALPEPRVVVIQDLDTPPGIGALLGEVHSNILRVSHAYAHIVEIGGEAEIGGLKINAGDLLHGDQHGLLVVPKKIATRIPAVAAKIAEEERRLIALCRSGDFTLEQLKAAVKR